jgi:hypothetical protein
VFSQALFQIPPDMEFASIPHSVSDTNPRAWMREACNANNRERIAILYTCAVQAICIRR